MTNQATDGKVASDDDLRFFLAGSFVCYVLYLVPIWYLCTGTINLNQTACA
jgi:hypothetical protein